MIIQIDAVKAVNNSGINVMKCNLYFGSEGMECVPIFMDSNSYERLKRAGFFIREGFVIDSAGVLNTSNKFVEVVNNQMKLT